MVDRPANPEAVFDCWKASGARPDARRFWSRIFFRCGDAVWGCGDPAHQHRKKDEADGCIRKRAAAPRVGPTVNPGAASRLIRDEADPAARARRLEVERLGNRRRAREGAQSEQRIGQAGERTRVVIERIAKQVNEIAHTPMPAQTVAYPHGLTGVSKNQDSGRGGSPRRMRTSSSTSRS